MGKNNLQHEYITYIFRIYFFLSRSFDLQKTFDEDRVAIKRLSGLVLYVQ